MCSFPNFILRISSISTLKAYIPIKLPPNKQQHTTKTSLMFFSLINPSTNTSEKQSVRRKKKKYVYIICSKNPKHKQRYVYVCLLFLFSSVSSSFIHLFSFFFNHQPSTIIHFLTNGDKIKINDQSRHISIVTQNPMNVELLFLFKNGVGLTYPHFM